MSVIAYVAVSLDGFLAHHDFIGTVSDYDRSHGGFMTPSDSLYHEKRDYWSFGAGGGFSAPGGRGRSSGELLGMTP